jgi:hypothetical protein
MDEGDLAGAVDDGVDPEPSAEETEECCTGSLLIKLRLMIPHVYPIPHQ